MKKMLFTGLACSLFLVFGCRSEEEPEFISNAVPDRENNLELSHAPAGKVRMTTSNVEIDFGYEGYIADRILSKIGQMALDTIYTRGRLIRFYETRRPVFRDFYSSHIPPDDNDFLFSKLEYLLAQECFQANCSAQTRRTVLQIALDKQKNKYNPNEDSSVTRKTGLFLMAVILVRENNPAFISAVRQDADLQNALLLKPDMRADKELADTLIRYAENFLQNK
jgi:hypothetical protein